MKKRVAFNYLFREFACGESKSNSEGEHGFGVLVLICKYKRISALKI